jgi:uncharacterized membrane protein YphA (DoxX/SURF4 family)
MLNLYNFNQFEVVDTILLVIGIPWTLVWLGIGIGMVRYIFILYIDNQWEISKYDYFFHFSQYLGSY